MTPEGDESSQNSKSVEALQAILEHEQVRPVTYDEAAEVGESLLVFYELLAGE